MSRRRIALAPAAFYILFRTVVPNCIAPAVILATLDIGTAVISFAALSFIGPGPGAIVAGVGAHGQHRHRFLRPVVDVALPGLAIASLVMAFNFHRRWPARYPRSAPCGGSRDLRAAATDAAAGLSITIQTYSGSSRPGTWAIWLFKQSIPLTTFSNSARKS